MAIRWPNQFGGSLVQYMMRGLILLLLAGALTFLAMPFVMTSRALDEHGITIPGRVHHKHETIRVLYSSWERSCDATIEYTVPESRSSSFFTGLSGHPTI